jgi:hypothetical protein
MERKAFFDLFIANMLDGFPMPFVGLSMRLSRPPACPPGPIDLCVRSIRKYLSIFKHIQVHSRYF